MNWLQRISASAAILITLGSVLAGVEHRYGPKIQVEANASEIKKIRLERRIHRIQQRIWALEDQFGFDYRTYPSKYRQEYRQLTSELEALLRELNGL